MLEEYAQKQCGRIEVGLLPSLHEGIPGMYVDAFNDEQGLGPRRQGGDETVIFLPFVGYNRDFPGKPGFLFAVMRFISGIH